MVNDVISTVQRVAAAVRQQNRCAVAAVGKRSMWRINQTARRFTLRGAANCAVSKERMRRRRSF